MSLPSVDQFWAWVVQSRLFTDAQFASMRSLYMSETDVRTLCPKLVVGRHLTRWQCQQLLLGRYRLTLSKYKLLDQLGRGGMGTVFKARHATNGRVVALKVVRSADVESSGGMARFQREVQAVAALNHPHIVAAFDADRDGEVQFLVMEFVDGHDLSYWIREYGRLPVAWACECIRQAALGLQHAHEQGLVHRDVKPSNVLVVAESVTSRPQVKILDLGMARYSDRADEQELTLTGQILGTPDYISPEQAEDTSGADIRSDIFSLGCTLFKALAGRVPFAGKNSMEKLMARARRDAPRVRSLRGSISVELDEVVAKMLRRDPAQRYQTPQQVAEALQPFSTYTAKPHTRRFEPISPEPPSADVHASMRPTIRASREETDEETGAHMKAFFEHVATSGTSAVEASSLEASSRPVIAAKKTIDDSDPHGVDVGPASSVSARSALTTSEPRLRSELSPTAGMAMPPRRGVLASRDDLDDAQDQLAPPPLTGARRALAAVLDQPALIVGVGLLAACCLVIVLMWTTGGAGRRQVAGPPDGVRRGDPAGARGEIEIVYKGIPVGNNYDMDLPAEHDGPYTLWLKVLDATEGSQVRVTVRERQLLDRALAAKDIGGVRIALGSVTMEEGRNPLSLELEAADAAPTVLDFSPWKVVGPFRGEEGTISFLSKFGPELDPAGTNAYLDSLGEKTYTPIDLGPEQVKPFGATTQARVDDVYYLRRVVRLTRPERVKLAFGFDGRVAGWANGKSLFARTKPPADPAAAPLEQGTVELKAGENVVLLKLAPSIDGAGFYEEYERSGAELSVSPLRYSIIMRPE